MNKLTIVVLRGRSGYPSEIDSAQGASSHLGPTDASLCFGTWPKSLIPVRLCWYMAIKAIWFLDYVKSRSDKIPVLLAHQKERLGTGHAVQQTQSLLEKQDGSVLVLSGDVPLLTKETISELLKTHHDQKAAATVLTAELADPYGYGRIVRDDSGGFSAIVEQRDATKAQQAINEINSGVYVFDRIELFSALSKINSNNDQGEYYLTDVLSVLHQKGLLITTAPVGDFREISGINTRLDLEKVSAVLREKILEELMLSGVTIVDAKNTYIDKSVVIEPDVIIEPNTYIKGRTVIARGSHIGPGTYIENSILEENSVVLLSHLVECKVGASSKIGPFANLRPGANLSSHVKVGNFVEIKNSELGAESKVSHLSYIGDSVLGTDVNIGAGTITCNYDGVKKSKTEIGNGAFVGSNTSFIAPVKVGGGALVAAGSVITKDVSPDALAISRTKQKIIKNGAKLFKKKE